ncbi:hypothetical protein BGZ60DRAFT_522583 [Tricladium varicosporioides]|nr:hypothetical protein BGZ60DRAFT_522583 [Hymenoscyphus varicosporioides]
MPVLANPASAPDIPTTYLFLASLVLTALIYYFKNKKSIKMSSPGASSSDEKHAEYQPTGPSHIQTQTQTQQNMNPNPTTPPNRHSLAAHSFVTSPTSISPGSIFASFPEPTLSLSPLHNPDMDRPKHGHAQTYPPPFPLSDENPASFFNTELAEEPSVFSSDSASKGTSHSASNSTSSNSNSNSEGSIPRRRSYTKPVMGTTNGEMIVQGEIIVAEGWRRHTRVFGGGVCKACEESSTEMERRRRLGLPVPPMMMGGEMVQS